MRELLPFGGHHIYDRFVGRPLAAFYARLAADFPTGRTLDIGCGPGHMAAALQATRDVVAMDKDPAQVRIAKRNHPELDVREGAAEELPFSDACFDLVVTSESYHHWSDPAAGVREAKRVLRPGGALIILEGAGDVTKAEVGAFLGRRPPPGGTAFARWVFRTHGFTPEAFHDELLPAVSAVFDDVDFQRIDGWWLVQAR